MNRAFVGSCWACAVWGAALTSGCGGSARSNSTTSTSSAGTSSAGTSSAGTSSAGTSSAGTNGISREDFPARMSAVYCDALSKCCPMIDSPFDAVRCAQNALFMMQNAYRTNPSTVAYSPAAAEGCLAAASQMLSACIRQAAASAAVDKACAAVFVGLLPTGGTCQFAQDCAPVSGAQVDCLRTAATDDHGSCVIVSERPAAPHAKLGEACLNTCMFDNCDAVAVSAASTVTADCYSQDGLYCDHQGVCQALVDDGATCEADECKRQSYCSFFDNVCEPKKPDGVICDFDYECASFSCWTTEQSGARSPVCGPPLIPSVKACAGNFN